jgi:hypothetical protein
MGKGGNYGKGARRTRERMMERYGGGGVRGRQRGPGW